ncbi:MAG: transposase, partial [Bacteroidetes bacterium]
IASIRKASERLEIMYLDKKEKEYYDAQQKRYLDESSRIQEAVEKAVKEAVAQTGLNKQIEITKNLISIGLDNANIAKGTGLTVEQIEALRKS